MSADLQKVRAVLRANLLSVEEVQAMPDTNKSWELRAFKPPADGSLWIEEKFIPGPERLVATNLVQATGLVQYDLCISSGKGTEPLDALALKIKEAFKPAHGLTDGTTGVEIDRSERRQAMVDGAWNKLPIVITWRTYASN